MFLSWMLKISNCYSLFDILTPYKVNVSVVFTGCPADPTVNQYLFKDAQIVIYNKFLSSCWLLLEHRQQQQDQTTFCLLLSIKVPATLPARLHNFAPKLCMCPNVNAGTHSNCIQHQLIWFCRKSRWVENPCWQMDWWTGLLCLVRLLLILLLLLLILVVLLLLLPPLPLHCGVYLLFSETGGCAGADDT